MFRRRLSHLLPRRLRWRLVLGFALTVALLQVVLTITERLLVQQTLTQSIQRNLEDTVSAGLAGPAFTQGLLKDLAFLSADQAKWQGPLAGKIAATATPGRGGEPRDRAGKTAANSMTTSRTASTLLRALEVNSRLLALTGVLSLPDQPVALLDANGTVLAQASTLAKDRSRSAPMAPAVLHSLLVAALPRVATQTKPWTIQVSTPDGPYLMVLWPTNELVLNLKGSKAEIGKMLSLLEVHAKAPVDPTISAALHGPRPLRLVVLIAHRLGETRQTLDTVTAISLGGATAVIVLAALISLLVVGRALRPLAAITSGAERLAQGDYRYRLALNTGSDEVGRLADAFDHMAAAIGAAFATQRRFVADASHELRTPLTALRGYTDVLLLGVGEDRATADRVLHAMREDLGRMSRLVNDLLTLARLDGGAPLHWEILDVADLLDAAADEGRAISQDAMQVITEPAPAGLAIRGDRDRLRQVFSNSVGNACAYCPPGSTIRLSAEAGSRWVTITVRDNGPGIPPSDLARLGERFYRGDAARSRQTGGAGLGLAIARAIVEVHGGALAVASDQRQGTMVRFSVPRASE